MRRVIALPIVIGAFAAALLSVGLAGPANADSKTDACAANSAAYGQFKDCLKTGKTKSIRVWKKKGGSAAAPLIPG
ncbi:hypothetical protein OG203_38045 [Nocardia sp. NBC_01499]|uniref:hypothetical protein n=1 Tax=Nocardia sp. NBC_01499 TaxID=2903597 RepID=UPI003866BEF6